MYLCIIEQEVSQRFQAVNCPCMRQVPMVTCILLFYTEITTNFNLPAERLHCKAMLRVLGWGMHAWAPDCKCSVVWCSYFIVWGPYLTRELDWRLAISSRLDKSMVRLAAQVMQGSSPFQRRMTWWKSHCLNAVTSECTWKCTWNFCTQHEKLSIKFW